MHAETPAQHMLGIIAANLSGKPPALPTLLAVRDALHRSADVYRPTAEAMKLQLQANAVDVSGWAHAHRAYRLVLPSARVKAVAYAAACMKSCLCAHDHSVWHAV